MKYVFFGTPHFAATVLSGLIDAGMPPCAIVCNPDRPVGRKHIVTPPPVKLLAIASSPDIDILQPEKLDEAFAKRLRELEPDFFVVAAYAKIIPQDVLDIPRLGTLGVHPSLLPKYRGAAPIQSAILAGETTTGVSIYLMDSKMDHGPVLAKESLIVGENESYTELEQRLASLAGSLLARTIPSFVDGSTIPQEQDHDAATFTKKFTTQDGFIDDADLVPAERGEATSGSAQAIHRKILALNPEPGTWTMRGGKRLKLLKTALASGEHGTKLTLLVTQREGERPKEALKGGL